MSAALNCIVDAVKILQEENEQLKEKVKELQKELNIKDGGDTTIKKILKRKSNTITAKTTYAQISNKNIIQKQEESVEKNKNNTRLLPVVFDNEISHNNKADFSLCHHNFCKVKNHTRSCNFSHKELCTNGINCYDPKCWKLKFHPTFLCKHESGANVCPFRTFKGHTNLQKTVNCYSCHFNSYVHICQNSPSKVIFDKSTCYASGREKLCPMHKIFGEVIQN